MLPSLFLLAAVVSSFEWKAPLSLYRSIAFLDLPACQRGWKKAAQAAFSRCFHLGDADDVVAAADAPKGPHCRPTNPRRNRRCPLLASTSP